MKFIKRNEKGFTLVELLVAIPIMGLIGLAMGAVLVQLLHSDRISERMLAVRQVQVAGDRVSQDAVQAQQVTFDNSMTAIGGFLNLSWTGQWIDDTMAYNSRTVSVTYTLVPVNGQYELQRHEVSTTIVGTTTQNRDLTTTVGEHLDASQMSCQWEAGGHTAFSFKVVSVVGTKTEERTYDIRPRSLG